MADLILQLILFFSFAVIVYLMAIAVPMVKDDELAANGKTIGSLPLERMDAFLNRWKEKVLRRLRIYLLKAESSVSSQLQKSKTLYNTERQKRSFRNIPSIRRSSRRKKLPEKLPEINEMEQS